MGNAVGLALSGKMAAARFNTDEHTIFDSPTSSHSPATAACREGVAMEACAFAGRQKLDNLILIYDANDVTLDAMAIKTQSENAALRYKAIGCSADGQR